MVPTPPAPTERSLAPKLSLLLNSIAGNGIGDEAAEALARGIAQNSSLQTLDLRMNNLTNSGARAVAEAVIHRGEGQWHAFNGVLFTDQKQMKAPDIDYSRCNMGPAGVMVLAGWLDRSKLLPTSLVLSGARPCMHVRARICVGTPGEKEQLAQEKALRG